MKRIYIIAIIASVLAGISLFNFLNMVKIESKVNFENVIVTIVDIEAHTVITAEMITTKQIPKEGIHQQSAKNPNEVIGLVTPGKLFKDEQIMTLKLIKIGEKTGGLSNTIPDNMRAVTVAVDEISGIAGFINPGDRVDILGVVTLDNVGVGTLTSTMLLQNISVLAVGKTLGETAGEAVKTDVKKVDYASVTLLTSPDDAVRLNLLTSTGAMRFILRGPTDRTINNVVPRTSSTISN